TLKAKKTTFKFDVKIENFSLCPRYMGIGVEGIKIAPSPKWMQDRLAAAGMRPINNIVDVTNYVMLELGQPLHAFDKNFIDKIIVRTAKNGEIIETLDGVKRKLESDMLVIANQTKPVAVAGVMGGANSEINDQTDSIIIEAANFDFNSVRKTAQKLSLRTEASMRFEKGLDPNLCELGLARAVELILQICPDARVATSLVDEKKYKKDIKPIELDLNWLNKFIGYEFTNKQIKQILEKLGFIVKASPSFAPAVAKAMVGKKAMEGKGNNFKVTVPSWRAVHDVSLPEDLAEEVVRIYGYNNLKAELPKIDLIPPLMIEEKILTRKIKNILSLGAGFIETYNYSFLSRQQAEKLKFDSIIKLANPLSEDLVILRPSLIPGILENIKTNQAQEAEIAIYEIGGVFLNKAGEMKKDDSGREKLPFQEKRLAIALASDGTEDLPAHQVWCEGLFRKLKGVIEFLLKSLNLETTFEFEVSKYNKFASAKIMVGDCNIGFVVELEKNIKQSFGIKKAAVIVEISLPELLNLVKNGPIKQFKEPPKYPLVSRDLAFVVNKKILYNNIKKQIINFNDLIKQVELFDVYQGDKLGAEKKSLAFHIIYQADKTLTSEEVDEVQKKLIKHLEKEFESKVRDF
ncbi:MAG: phenylalanine--tRNA ligase subunit beta, partial [Patescibacteria group bacterium]